MNAMSDRSRARVIESLKNLGLITEKTSPDYVSASLEDLERLNLIERAVVQSPDSREKEDTLSVLKEFRGEFAKAEESRKADRKADNEVGERRHTVSVALAVGGMVLSFALGVATTWISLAFAAG